MRKLGIVLAALALAAVGATAGGMLDPSPGDTDHAERDPGRIFYDPNAENTDVY